MSKFFIINLSGLSILEQLRLEEALLRADKGNYCLINSGASDAIVMGISGKVEKLIDQKAHQKQPVPLIKRFSGGGTVYVDEETIFVTFIANEVCSGVPALPKKIMSWSEELYSSLFAPHPFALQENDYTMGDKKFGGNAQYVQKGRWLHHTSFLWDYTKEKMKLLKLPEKRPAYRANRAHTEFLTTLSSYYKDKQSFIEELTAHLTKTLSATEMPLEEALAIASRPHRKATTLQF